MNRRPQDLDPVAVSASAPPSAARRVERDLEHLVRARYPLLYLLTSEERRAGDAVRRIARARQMQTFFWSITEGMKPDGDTPADFNPLDLRDPLKALQFVLDRDVRALFVMRDPHPYLKNPEVVRRLRDAAHRLKHTKKTLILLSGVLSIPPEAEKEIAVVEFPLPDQAELGDIFQRTLDDARAAFAHDSARKEHIDASLPARDRIVEAALGLTADEAENVFARSLVETGTFDIPVILSEKERIVRKSGVLEFFPAKERMDHVGGLDRLKDWLARRQAAFGRQAREYGLPTPRGLLLLGVPGCGKSLTAKAVGHFWQLPLLRLDMGRVFAGLVGSSEENMRRAIAMAEAVAPSILWLDELEKGVAGSQSSGQSDGGTSARVFGSFLSWMQEKTSPVFVIATANDVSQLPPELLRKGRFDDIFFVDLPSPSEREAIFRIHLTQRGRDPAAFDLPRLAQASDGMSGAEIEQALTSAMFDAFSSGDEVSDAHLLRALGDTVPLSRTMKEQLAALRDWSRTRARPASSPPQPAPDTGRTLDF